MRWQANGAGVDMTTEAVVRNKNILLSCDSVGRSRNLHRETSNFNRIILNVCISSVVIEYVESWDRKPMEDDEEENQGVDKGAHRTNEVCLFFIALTVVGGQMSSVLNVEDSTSRSRKQKLSALNVYPVNLAFAMYR